MWLLWTSRSLTLVQRGQNRDVGAIVVLHVKGGEDRGQIRDGGDIGEGVAVDLQIPDVGEVVQKTEIGEAAVVEEELLERRQVAEQGRRW